MTAHPRAERFTAALRRFEDSGDSSELSALFGENPELARPEVAGADDGRPDLARFWDEYRSQFSHIRTDFMRVDECGDLGVLEWVSRGTLSTGRPIEYRGTSLLTFDEQGRVRRFATYFDTAAFLQPDTPPHGSG